MNPIGNSPDPGGSQTKPKKRKSETIVNISTQNRFDVLSDEEENEDPEPNPNIVKIPPVII